MSQNVEHLPSNLAAHMKRMERIAWYAEQMVRGAHDTGVALVGFNVKLPVGLGGECLVVIRGTSEEGVALVAFQSGDDMITAMFRAFDKWWTSELKWREDEWRK